MLYPDGQDGVGQHFPGTGGIIRQAPGWSNVRHL